MRSTHAANHGRVFSWDEPPSTGHPGSEFGCRCWAQPVAAPPAASLPDDPPVESVYPELLLIPALRAGGAIKRGFQLLKGLRNKLQDAGEGAQEIPTETPQEILMPDGEAIGVAGDKERVRELKLILLLALPKGRFCRPFFLFNVSTKKGN